MDSFLIGLSIVLALISPVVYGVSMLRGNSKPARMTRFIIWLAASISFVSLLSEGSQGAVWLAGVFAFRSLGLFAMSLRYGVGGWSRVDKTSLMLAGIGLAGWQLFDEPLLALLAAVAADFIGFIPAYIKTWREPTTEGPWFYVIEAIAVVLNIVVIREWSQDLIFPMYILISGLIMLAIIYKNGLFPRSRSYNE